MITFVLKKIEEDVFDSVTDCLSANVNRKHHIEDVSLHNVFSLVFIFEFFLPLDLSVAGYRNR